ncbi:MAG: hypothetical protein JWN20_822, partial [Jatrophihabitantaceae bacterium]|nr:hypothetical protein [Jatrophihabitantaceae bacterium]
MTDPTTQTGPVPGPPVAGRSAPAGEWIAPVYDVHPPAETDPTGPDGPSHFGGSASAADADQTTVLPVVDDGPPLVWPELRGTPLIGRFVPLADDEATPGAPQPPVTAPPSLAAPVGPPPPLPIPAFIAPGFVAPRITDPKPPVVPIEATLVAAPPVQILPPEPVQAELAEVARLEAAPTDAEPIEVMAEAERVEAEPLVPEVPAVVEPAEPPAAREPAPAEATPPEQVDPPTTVIEVVTAELLDDEPYEYEPTEAEPIEAEPVDVEPAAPAAIDLVKAEPDSAREPTIFAEPEEAEAVPAAAVDIEPIAAVLAAPEPVAEYQPLAGPVDPPTEAVERIEAEPLPEPSASLISALQAMSPPTAYAPPPTYAPSPAYAPPPDYAPPITYAAPPVAYAAPMAYAQAYSAPPPQQAPMWAAPVQRSRATQSVTCPQCGTVVPVDSQSRSSLDFCPNPVCDFPLFWVKSAIIADATAYGDGSSHRRLPGTAGRAIAASMACPHCTEPNPISGVVCVRCGLDLRPIAVAPAPPPPPAPEPVYIAQEIEDPINWWLIILVGALIVLFFAALAFIAVAYLVD